MQSCQNWVFTILDHEIKFKLKSKTWQKLKNREKTDEKLDRNKSYRIRKQWKFERMEKIKIMEKIEIKKLENYFDNLSMETICGPSCSGVMRWPYGSWPFGQRPYSQWPYGAVAFGPSGSVALCIGWLVAFGEGWPVGSGWSLPSNGKYLWLLSVLFHKCPAGGKSRVHNLQCLCKISMMYTSQLHIQ